MRRWMHILMLSCPRATELMEKSQVFRLSWMEKARLFMHTSICNACRRYRRQSRLLDDILRQHHHSANPPGTSSTVPDNTALKQKIIRRLEEN